MPNEKHWRKSKKYRYQTINKRVLSETFGVKPWTGWKVDGHRLLPGKHLDHTVDCFGAIVLKKENLLNQEPVRLKCINFDSSVEGKPLQTRRHPARVWNKGSSVCRTHGGAPRWTVRSIPHCKNYWAGRKLLVLQRRGIASSGVQWLAYSVRVIW